MREIKNAVLTYPTDPKVIYKDFLKPYHRKLRNYLYEDHNKIVEMYAGQDNRPRTLLEKMHAFKLREPIVFQLSPLEVYMEYFGEEHIGFIIDVVKLYKLRMKLS